MWEKRYGIITPERTDTNIRHYCDTDLKKLLNIAILNTNGYKISKIADLEIEELHDCVTQVCENGCPAQVHVDRLAVAMVDLDEIRFEKFLPITFYTLVLSLWWWTFWLPF